MDWQMFIAGIVISLVVALFIKGVFEPNKYKRFFLIRFLWGLLYIPILFFYILLANLDVLLRIINPVMPLHPGIVKVKTKLKTNAGRTILANSITLTPGTMTVDITEDGYLYIHWIDVKETETEQATKQIVDKFEKILIKIFE